MTSRPPPASTFVIRLWPEWSEHGPVWRGHIVHLQSGQASGFQDPAAVLDFMRQMAEQGPHHAPPSTPQDGHDRQPSGDP
ncbi:MAG: hypothetical protein IT318_14475 [Anaerolineales bacterium]|nr:hypothetical protein [Anaerolineales bacterium]